jgi:four helix bundle protein
LTFEEWANGVPTEIQEDSLWRVEAYRLGLFLSDLGWKDATKLLRDRRMSGIADQLCRAVGNISSNIAEGYSRGTGKDRARFYEYALGSARETPDWYFKARHVLSEAVVKHRMEVSTNIIRLLLKMVATERKTNRRVAESTS